MEGDDEGEEEKVDEDGNKITTKKLKDPIDKFLNKIPPDFNHAEIHGVSSRVLTFSNANQSST